MRHRPLLFTLALCGALLNKPLVAATLAESIDNDLPSLMTLYRHLHQYPELSGREVKTAAMLAGEARKLGFEVTEDVGGTGVVAMMNNGPGPVVMIRADMDALPVIEQTGLTFASKVTATTEEGMETGVMHACGHDTHMAGWLGTARQLVKRRSEWSGTLMMILQPAEERGRGARDMLNDGLFTRFAKPDYALAFHNSSAAPAGEIGYTPGYTLANVDSVNIVVHGVGGHGAYPQSTKDPIVLGSRIVGALQTLVSRELDPQDPAVVTVGSFQAGSKHNIISDKATLLLTVRSYSDQTRQQLLDGIARIAKGEAIAAGLPEALMPEVTWKQEYTPSTWNDPEFTRSTAALLSQHFGRERVKEGKPSMAGEDFGRYYRADNSIKSMIFWVGGVPKERWDKAQQTGEKLPSLHSPFWAPQADKVVATATEALTVATLHLLAK
ncbi:M20 family metallopeptidase [Bowmanella denitrificans]|uniref:M20 family metallopeptidase n=1 Tax=Bowmanella denitrificans TaxID=366582 RepID=A0ABP3GPJ6_9ALTE